MSTLHAPASRINRFSSGTFCGGNATSLIPSGHVDEAIVDHDDDDNNRAVWAEFEEGLAEAEQDQIVQQADDVHASVLAGAVRYAKAKAGNLGVEISRNLTDEGADFPVVSYTARLTGSGVMHCGVGNSPHAAVDHAIWTIDTVYLIPKPYGFEVTGVAYVAGFPDRAQAEAKQIARRIAMEPSYLDASLALRVEGITDLRGEPSPAVAA